MNGIDCDLLKTASSQFFLACEREKIKASLDFCIYFTSLKFLKYHKKKDENFLEKIVQECVEALRSDLLCIATIKLQLLWRKKYRSRIEIKKTHHETIFKNVIPIMAEIVEANQKKNLDKEDLYKKIVIFIIMFAGLGNPTRQPIFMETEAALHSIFKNSEIDNFLILPKSMKEQQLIEFARLVTGIRLFNKDCQKGGEGIEDLPLIVTQGVRATKERVITFKDQLDKRIDYLTKVLFEVYNLKNIGKDLGEIEILPDFQQDLEEIKNILIHCRQIELCLNDLIKDLDDSSATIEDFVKRLQSILIRIHDVVRFRVAISTVQVFPLFLQLSNVWVEMQEEIDNLSEINNMFGDLTLNSKLMDPTQSELLLRSKIDSPLSTEINYIDDYSRFPLDVKICSFSSVSRDKYLEYKGFCAWTLAQTEGVLITGNITIGVLLFNEKFYSFVSAEAAYSWGRDPKNFIKKVANVVRNKPELINLLKMYSDLKTMEEVSVDEGEKKKQKMENIGIQTVIHPVEAYMCKNYTFSEWELKRRALKMSALTKCLTKSQQTMNLISFKADVGIQAVSKKNMATQTKKNEFSNYFLLDRNTAFGDLLCQKK